MLPAVRFSPFLFIAFVVGCRGPSPAAQTATHDSAGAEPTLAPPPPSVGPQTQYPLTLPAPSPPVVRRSDYDLDQDVTRRVEEAGTHLGSHARTAVVRDVFVVAGPRGYDTHSFAGTLSVVRRALDAYFNGRFTRLPGRAVSVYLFPSAAPYHQHCRDNFGRKCSTPYGFYLPDERRIVMNIGLGVGTLTHELVHPIMEADFPEAPTWIDEGIASLFENFGFPAQGEITGYTNWRLPRLRRALTSAERANADLTQLFGMSDATFRNDDEDLHYAMARYFCQWLDRRGELWSFYHHFRDHHASDPTGRTSFETATGLTPREAAPIFRTWVLTL